MAHEQVLRYLPVIASYVKEVGFTGGEPLLFRKELLPLIRQCSSFGLKVRVATGGGWAHSRDLARTVMVDLVDAGVTTLAISWDRYHARFLPEGRPVMIAEEARRAGLKVHLALVGALPGEVAAIEQTFLGLDATVSALPVSRLGRARDLPAEDLALQSGLPLERCLSVPKITIEPEGTVYACCGPGRHSTAGSSLILGNAEDESLADIIDRALADPVLKVIALQGPAGLVRLLDGTEAASKFKPREGYSTICELCVDVNSNPELMSAIRERLSTKERKRVLAALELGLEAVGLKARATCGNRVTPISDY